MNEIIIKINDLSKCYHLYNSPKQRLKEAFHPFKKEYHQKYYALKNINLEIKKGEILGVVGKNGSGKSTLLKLISGIISSSSGQIVINGKVSALLELGSGLNPEYNGIQNIYFSGMLMGFSKKEMSEKVNDIVEFADIGDYIRQPLKSYSNGMKMRLSFALAINMEPEILVIDEVLAVGDELFRRKCFAKMEEFFKSGCTVIIVSHSVSTINEICTRAIFLDKGELVFQGDTKTVTMLYEKFLFSKREDSQKIRDDIIKLNISRNGTEINRGKIKLIATGIGKGNSNSIKSGMEFDQKAIYIPNFKSKSKVEYNKHEVTVFDIHMRCNNGIDVNSLVIDDEYSYSYKMSFNNNAEDVSFGIRFKTEKGIHISGSALHLQKTKLIVEKGDVFFVNWDFKCTLLPGNYYITMGISAVKDNKRIYLNRIEDAFVFKVQKREGLFFTGLVHLNQRVDYKKLIL